MNPSRSSAHLQRQRGYFALSLALLVSVVASGVVLSLRSKLARMDAEGVLIDDREDYAIARQLEQMMHQSIQQKSGQRSLTAAEDPTMESLVSDHLSTLSLPENATVSLSDDENACPTPPALAFYPATPVGWSRIPETGALAADAIPYGPRGELLRFGYYQPTAASQTYEFVRSRGGVEETVHSITASYEVVPLLSQRLILYNLPVDLGGTRSVSAPDFSYLDASAPVSGLITTQFVTDGEIIDAVSAPGADQSLNFYRHRNQVTEEIYPFLFGGSYLGSIQSHEDTVAIDMSDFTAAVDGNEGLSTEEQDNTPEGEPLPEASGTEARLDLAAFPSETAIYFHSAGDDFTLTLRDTAASVGTPLVIVFDAASAAGSFTVKFEEIIERPLYAILTGSTLEFSGATTGVPGMADGAIAGTFLLDNTSSLSADESSVASTRCIYGTLIGHWALLESGFVGAGNHPTPVRVYPSDGYYESLEGVSPRVLLVATRSHLTPVERQTTSVLVP